MTDEEALEKLRHDDEMAAAVSEFARFLIGNGADIDFAIRSAVLEHLTPEVPS